MPDKYEEVIIVLIASTTIFIVLIGIVVFVLLFYQKKKFQHYQQILQLQKQYAEELLQSGLEIQENTFLQISEEIHDNIGQLLSSTKMLLGLTERGLTNIPDTLLTAEETLGKAIHDLRLLSKSLNKDWLTQFNLIENLKLEVERMNSSGLIHLNLDAATNFLPLNTNNQIILFRIIQEAIQNSIKHGNPNKITIKIILEEQIKVLFEDDGTGFKVDESNYNGIGTINMKNRAALLRGTITWNSELNKGTKIFIIVPVSD